MKISYNSSFLIEKDIITFNNTDLSKIKQLPFFNYLSDDYAFLRKGRYNKSDQLCPSVIASGFFRACSESSSSKFVHPSVALNQHGVGTQAFSRM